jgi:hypothetical protein
MCGRIGRVERRECVAIGQKSVCDSRTCKAKEGMKESGSKTSMIKREKKKGKKGGEGEGQ